MTEIIVTTKAELSSLITESVQDALGKKPEPTPEVRTEPYTKTELKNLLQTTLPTIDRWSKSGILERITIGHRVYFSAESVHKLLKK